LQDRSGKRGTDRERINMRERELDWKAYLECARRAAADGIVLLANEKEALPLPEGAVVSLFGRGQLTYYKSGTGSGTSVKRAGFLATTKNNVFRLHFSQPGVKLNRLVITKNSPGDDPRIGLLAD
jgi:hypothetical protein